MQRLGRLSTFFLRSLMHIDRCLFYRPFVPRATPREGLKRQRGVLRGSDDFTFKRISQASRVFCFRPRFLRMREK